MPHASLALDPAGRRLVRRPRGHGGVHRRHRSDPADAVPHRRGRRGDAGGDRARRRRSVGAAHRTAPVGRGRCAPGHRVAAQRPLHEAGRRRGFARGATRSWASIPTKDGRWSYLHCNFPNHRAAALSVLGVRGGPRRGGAARWRTGTPPTSRRRSSPPRAPAAWCARRRNGRQHPQAAAIAALPLMEIVQIGDSAAGAAAGRRPAAVGHPRARPDARAGRPDLRPHPGRARRRRAEDHRRASAQPRLPGVRHRARQAVGAARSARAARCRDAARAGARGRRVLAGLSARHAGRCAACRPRSWRRSGPASSMSRCARSAMPGRGRRGAASTRWCRPSAASPRARPRWCRARRRDRSSIRCRRSTIAPAT